MLKKREFTGRSDGPHLLITGGVHGDEFEPIATIHRLISAFEQQQESVADFCGRVTLVPIVNEAAWLRGHRVAEDGLDLARTCPGKPDGSVTERTAWALSELIRSVDFYIDLHTGGTELSLYPLAGYSLHPKPEILAIERRMAQAFNLPVVWGTWPHHEGRSLSIARDANVPAIYAEYSGAATCDPQGVDAYYAGCLNVMTELGMLNGERPESKVQYTVEDPRPASGHLQVCNPSPLTGFFEPCVQLGDRIEAGSPLGTVFDPHSSESVSIKSPHAGIVLTLRTFPRVHEGHSVGVILETEIGEAP